MPSERTETAESLERLREEIRHHDRMYYVEANPEITDLEYDRLLKRLMVLEEEHPEWVTPDSPTRRVGDAPVGHLQQVTHRQPMLSIENTYTVEELSLFFERIERTLGTKEIAWVMEYKVDGVAASVIYEDGHLVRAVTRGNGQVGDDITHNLRTVRGVPLKLLGEPPPVLEVRGEVYMTNRDLEELNLRQQQAGLEPFKNTRNVTAGTVRLLDPRLCAERNLRFFVHGVGHCEGLQVATHTEFLERVKQWGLPSTPHVRRLVNREEALEAVNDLEAQLHSLDFEVDGVVFKVDRLDQRSLLGSTSKSPRWVIAYKFEKYETTTQLESIEVQVGKTGTITPVANLKPVEIAGTTVSRASLHNVDELERLDVRVGDWVVVEKAGKIIPHVVRVEKHRRAPGSVPFVFPKRCPKCDSELVRDEGGVYIRCPNLACPEKLRQRLIFFASRDGLDIDGLGEKIVEQLVEQGLVARYEDLFKLNEEQLLRLEKFGRRKAKKLLEGIEAAKDRGLARLLTSIAIRHVGSRVSRVIAQAFPDMDKLMAASVEELSQVPEVGPTIALSVHSFLHGSEGRAIIEGLRGVGVRMDEETTTKSTTGVLSGKTVVVTGTLSRYSRDSIEKLIADLGGRAASSVSRKTDFLVAGEKAGSKMDQARKLGVKILTEDEFEQMVAPHLSSR